ncbi:hypothetical protein Acr_00g0088630 [Actinidia rufa]|uniref:Uncharacterized protein n=1 Tax=Actinidia rufa TaxID=165716 RepID=A0A7J0DWM6_9ERIC|nr:hypothetical protein Acr_00g0088630 [Actinidia rufa]
MCYEVKCSTCGKMSWGGCGMHVASVHKRISEGQHCQCKEWPGIKAGSDNSAAATSENSAAATAKPRPLPIAASCDCVLRLLIISVSSL